MLTPCGHLVKKVDKNVENENNYEQTDFISFKKSNQFCSYRAFHSVFLKFESYRSTVENLSLKYVFVYDLV